MFFPTVNSATSAPSTTPATAAPVSTAAPMPVPDPTASPVSTPAPVPQEVSVVRQRLLTRFALQGGTERAALIPNRTNQRSWLEQRHKSALKNSRMPSWFSIMIAEFQGSPFPGWISATGWQRNNLDPCSGWLGTITCAIQGRVTYFVGAMVENLMRLHPRRSHPSRLGWAQCKNGCRKLLDLL
jgi:hypothetical protein